MKHIAGIGGGIRLNGKPFGSIHQRQRNTLNAAGLSKPRHRVT
ncbi:hypothetical protein O9992_23925 [Vibrio lentus]|nr:hypothetical protein [Vibrio lentus]